MYINAKSIPAVKSVYVGKVVIQRIKQNADFIDPRRTTANETPRAGAVAERWSCVPGISADKYRTENFS